MDKGLVLKYLGYENQTIDKPLDMLIDRCIESVAAFQGHTIHKTFDLTIDDFIVIEGTILKLAGRSIRQILSQASQVVVFAATLGPQMDQMILKAGYRSSVEQMVLDACASARIEELLDEMEAAIPGYKTPRFSPGYGDLELTVQRDLINVVEGRRIGITVTDSQLLLPKKSVTGFIGVSDEKMNVTYGFCDDCLKRRSCDYKTCNRE